MESINGSVLDIYLNRTGSHNRTLPRARGGPPADLLLMVTLLPMAIMIALINGFVFFLFATRKKLRTPANYLLVSLAVADFITGIIIIPLFISYSLHPHSQLRSRLGLTFEALSKLTAILTSYHILVVTADKYIAIVKPLQHHSANPKMVFKVLGLVWCVSSVIAVVPSSWKIIARQKPNAYKMNSVYLQLGHDIFCLVVVFLLPYIFIIYAQTTMFRAISKRKHNLHRTKTTKSTRQRRTRMTNDKKCLFVFGTMATMFAICWLPWFIFTFLVTLSSLLKLRPLLFKMLPAFKAFAIIRFATSIINPLLYTFFKRDFMTACKSVCRRVSGYRSSTRMTSAISTITRARNAKQHLRKNSSEGKNEQLLTSSVIEEQTAVTHVTSL